MHELATVSVIQDIRPIEGKDRIVLARVENYDSIVQKDGFKVGDKVIYVYQRTGKRTLSSTGWR